MITEQNIVDAMLGGAKFEAKTTVKAVVCHHIFCPTPGCGRVMDVRSALVFENAGGEVIAGCCGQCAEKGRAGIAKAAAGLRAKGIAPGAVAARILSYKKGIERVLVPEETP